MSPLDFKKRIFEDFYGAKREIFAGRIRNGSFLFLYRLVNNGKYAEGEGGWLSCNIREGLSVGLWKAVWQAWDFPSICNARTLQNH